LTTQQGYVFRGQGQIDFDAAFGHHFLDMAKAKRIGHVPTYAGQHQVQRIVQPLQYLAQRVSHRHQSIELTNAALLRQNQKLS
jgi:hypothetical protein